MPQSVKGRSTNPLRLASQASRPGQRQQERIQRAARRQRRQRIITSVVAAFLVIVLGVAGTIWFQNYTAQQIVLANIHGTATANASTHSTATAITKDCFVNPSGPTVPAIYDGTATPAAGPSSSPSLSGQPVSLAAGLKYVDIRTGTGAAAKSGSNILVNYTGWIASTCQKFSSSYDSIRGTPGTPFTLKLGAGQVIPGWDKGLIGIKGGGIRRLYIPSALAYGTQGSQDSSGNQVIPANADLIFDVFVASVK